MFESRPTAYRIVQAPEWWHHTEVYYSMDLISVSQCDASIDAYVHADEVRKKRANKDQKHVGDTHAID